MEHVHCVQCINHGNLQHFPFPRLSKRRVVPEKCIILTVDYISPVTTFIPLFFIPFKLFLWYLAYWVLSTCAHYTWLQISSNLHGLHAADSQTLPVTRKLLTVTHSKCFTFWYIYSSFINKMITKTWFLCQK